MDDALEFNSRIGRFIRAQVRPYESKLEPQPLRLEWYWLVLLSIALGYFTGTVFIDLWLLLQANWLRRATGRTRGTQLAAWNLAIDCAWGLGLLLAKISFVSHFVAGTPFDLIVGTFGFARLCIYFGCVFVMRKEMGAEPIGLPLSGFMTAFFAPYYFQYWLHDYVFVRLTSR